MSRHESVCILLLLTLACTSASSSDSEIAISNDVESCVRFLADRTRSDGVVALLETRVEHLKSTAECGCKNGLLSYRVVEQIGDTGLTGQIMSGRITGMQPVLMDRALFVVDTDQTVGMRGPRTLEVGCAPAD